MVRAISLVVLLALVGVPAAARADVRGVLRVGVTPVDLAPAPDTPVIGARVDDAVEAYNAAADAYNAAHGHAPGSAMATDAIARDDLGVRADLFTLTPALEAGSPWVFFRVEASFGFADDLRAYGIGVYPVNVATTFRRGTIAPYVSAGGTASWLDRTSADGELGALLVARVAVGVRLARRLTIEVGYGAAVLGAIVDRARLDTMTDYDPRGDAPPPHPDRAIAGGEQRGLIDVSLGLAL